MTPYVISWVHTYIHLWCTYHNYQCTYTSALFYLYYDIMDRNFVRNDEDYSLAECVPRESRMSGMGETAGIALSMGYTPLSLSLSLLVCFLFSVFLCDFWFSTVKWLSCFFVLTLVYCTLISITILFFFFFFLFLSLRICFWSYLYICYCCSGFSNLSCRLFVTYSDFELQTRFIINIITHIMGPSTKLKLSTQ